MQLTLVLSLFLAQAINPQPDAPSTESTDVKPAADTPTSVETVVVVGSRTQGRTAVQTSVPVDIIEAKALRETGSVELGQLMQTLAPSFNFERTMISDGSDLFRPMTLRGLGPDQVLVLVNGKRRHQRSLLGAIGTMGEGATGTDFNAIPIAAIKRIEILRDGAAAQYGSDAIAGVINIILQDSVDESLVSTRAGATYEGDGATVQVHGNTGVRLLENGFLNLTAEFREGQATNRADISPFYGDRRHVIGDPAVRAALSMFNFSLPFSEHLELYAFGGYSFNQGKGAGFYRFVNNAARAVPQVYADGFLPRNLNQSHDASAAVGLRGAFTPAWSYDTSVVYGRNDYRLHVRNSINTSIAAAFYESNPNATASDIRANAGPTVGFSGGLSFDQLTMNADVKGDIPIGLRDPLHLATGVEYRRESFRVIAGQLESYSCGLSPDNAFVPSLTDPSVAATCGFQAYPGFRPEAERQRSRDVFAVFVDLENEPLPLLRLGLASRYENYPTIGDEVTGKATARLQLHKTTAWRAAVATGFRAPSLQQTAFTSISTNSSAAGLTETLLAEVGSPFPAYFGIDKLTIERSKSASTGFVFQPWRMLTFTADAFIVDIDDRIVLGNPLRPDQLDGVPEARDYLLREGIGQANFFSNALNTRTLGLDLVATYATRLFDGHFSTTLGVALNKTQIRNVESPSGVDPLLLVPEPSRRFVETGQPRRRANLSVHYARPVWSTLLRLNYFGPTANSLFTAAGLGYTDEQVAQFGLDPSPLLRVQDAVLVDVELTYTLIKQLRFTIGANNLLNTKPKRLADNDVMRFFPNDPSGQFGNIQYPLAGLTYGINGGYYYARLDARF